MTIDLDRDEIPAAASFPYAAVWLDHAHAKVVFASNDRARVLHVEGGRGDAQLPRPAGEAGSHRVLADTSFYGRVADALDANESDVIVTGPGTAKHDFRSWLVRHRHPVAARLRHVETLGHPSDREFVAHVRQEFLRIDRLGQG